MIVAGLAVSPAYRAYHLLWQGVDWLYPPVCGGCGRPGSRWCTDCQNASRRFPIGGCQQCGRSNRTGTATQCDVCLQERPPYQALGAWFVYESGIRNAIHQLKYKRDLGLGEAYAGMLGKLVREQGWPVDLVVPVPLGSKRMRERGYNQAAVLAFPLALMLGVPYRPRTLRRERETITQVGLSGPERHSNMIDAFQADARLAAGRRVLIVDDVMTTGATLSACAQALRSAGAVMVFGITLARVA